MDPEFEWHTRDEKLRVVAYWWTEQEMKCCICGDKMEPYHRDATAHPLRATIEHVIPRRDGGPNTVKNVRLAHALCNHTLGQQWERNRQRAERGLGPISDEEALASAWGNYYARTPDELLTPIERAKREAAKHSNNGKKPKQPGVSWNAGNAISLPRGATLIPEHQKALGIVVKNRIAKPKMSARETARWLAESGVRGA